MSDELKAERAALLEEARDPRTLSARLSAIVQQYQHVSNSAELMRAVAGNPSTPPGALRWLLATCPDEVLRNPVLPLILLEDLQFIQRTVELVALQVLRRGDLAPYLVGLFAQHASATVAHAAELHVAVAGEAGPEWREQVVALLAKQPVWGAPELLELAELAIAPLWLLVRLAGRCHLNERRAALRGLETLALDPVVDPEIGTAAHRWLELLRKAAGDRELRCIAAPDLEIAPEALTALARGELWARLLVARHPRTPPEVLRRLVDDRHRTVRHRVLRNPAAPFDVLERFSAGADAFDRLAAARNPKLPVELRKRLAGDPEANTRAAIARIVGLSSDELHGLSTDSAPEVRAAVARHPRTAPSDLEALACDPDVAVRLCVAANPSTSPPVLERLGEDPNPRVRRALLRRADLPAAQRARLAAAAVPAAEVARSAVAPDAIERPAEAGSESPPSPFTRHLELAADPHTPAGVLVDLAGWSNRAIRELVAANPALPEAAVEKLLHHENEWGTLAALAANRRVSGRSLARLVERHGNADVCELVARNRNATAELLSALAAHRYWTVREAVAEHPRTPEAMLLRLAADSGVQVRRAVMRRTAVPAGAVEACREAAIRWWGNSDDRLHRFTVLSDPRLPVQELERAANGADWLDRLAVALNANAPAELLERLAIDGNRLVRAAAREAQSGRLWDAGERDRAIIQAFWGYVP